MRWSVLEGWNEKLDVTLERQCSFLAVALDMAAELQTRKAKSPFVLQNMCEDGPSIDPWGTPEEQTGVHKLLLHFNFDCIKLLVQSKSCPGSGPQRGTRAGNNSSSTWSRTKLRSGTRLLKNDLVSKPAGWRAQI